MSYTIPYSKGLDGKNARKSAEVFVGEIIENKNKENGKLIARLKQEERKNKSVRANRDYRKEKAERLQRENIELRNRLDAYELALNIWSEGHSELIVGQNYERQFENGVAKYDLKVDKNGKVVSGGEFRELC